MLPRLLQWGITKPPPPQNAFIKSVAYVTGQFACLKLPPLTARLQIQSIPPPSSFPSSMRGQLPSSDSPTLSLRFSHHVSSCNCHHRQILGPKIFPQSSHCIFAQSFLFVFSFSTYYFHFLLFLINFPSFTLLVLSSPCDVSTVHPHSTMRSLSIG